MAAIVTSSGKRTHQFAIKEIGYFLVDILLQKGYIVAFEAAALKASIEDSQLASGIPDKYLFPSEDEDGEIEDLDDPHFKGNEAIN
jgi:hypothetical protein